MHLINSMVKYNCEECGCNVNKPVYIFKLGESVILCPACAEKYS